MSKPSSPSDQVTLVFCGHEPRLYRFGWASPGESREFPKAFAEALIASSDWQLPAAKNVKEVGRDS